METTQENKTLPGPLVRGERLGNLLRAAAQAIEAQQRSLQGVGAPGDVQQFLDTPITEWLRAQARAHEHEIDSPEPERYTPPGDPRDRLYAASRAILEAISDWRAQDRAAARIQAELSRDLAGTVASYEGAKGQRDYLLEVIKQIKWRATDGNKPPSQRCAEIAEVAAAMTESPTAWTDPGEVARLDSVAAQA